MSTTIDKSNQEFWLTKAQFNSRYSAGTLVVGAIYHITDEKLTCVYTGTTAPTTSTAGEIGDMYVNTTNSDIYICVASGSTYTWVGLASTSDISGKANLSGGNTFSGDQTLTGALNVQNGSASGCMVIGADLNATSVSNGVRKLGRIGFHTYENTVNCAFVSTDSTSGKNSTEFGGRSGDNSTTSPDFIGFTTAKTHNTLVSSQKELSMMATPTKVQMFCGAKSPTDSDVAGKWEFNNGNTFVNNTYTYTLPDKTGTIATTDDLSSKANLTGGNTFTGQQIFNHTINNVTNQLIVNDSQYDVFTCQDTTTPTTKTALGKGYVWTQNNSGNTYSQFRPEGIYYGRDDASPTYERVIKFPTTGGTDEQTFLTNANFTLNGTTLTITI